MKVTFHPSGATFTSDIPTPSQEVIEQLTKPGKITALAYTTTGKIGFPEYIRGGLFQLFRKIPFGWRIIGRIKSRCSWCEKKLFVGEENGKKFSFCKRCLNK